MNPSKIYPSKIYIQLPDDPAERRVALIVVENYIGIVETFLHGDRRELDPLVAPDPNPAGRRYAVVLPFRYTQKEVSEAIANGIDTARCLCHPPAIGMTPQDHKECRAYHAGLNNLAVTLKEKGLL